jgi:DNA replication ATP-dependent helicase Dna2
MPYLSKRSISSFLRSECLRRLKLDLSPDNATFQHERTTQNMPPRAVGRPGLRALADAGTEWEIAKVNDLVQTFGLAATLGNHVQLPTGGVKFNDAPLAQVIQRASPGTFLVQTEYGVGATFEHALNISHYRNTFNLRYADLRPDLIQVLSVGAAQEEVRPDGSVVRLQPGDARIPLRIIDIKLTAEPSVPYLAEVTYYAMTLAGWLADDNITGFFVVPEAAVWPGSHDASALVRLDAARRQAGQRPTHQELLDALGEDLELVPFGVFAPRLRRFFQSDLHDVLSAQWTNLEWHVDNRCIGCEYLGYPWPGSTTSDPRHCWPTATSQDHLSRVAFVSRGAAGALVDNNITNVAALASTAMNSPAYDTHHVLRATRSVVAGRAQSLGTQQAFLPPQTGTSAVMPKWTDLRIYITADFDIGSGISVAFGLKGFFWAHQNRINPGQQQTYSWQSRVFPIDQRSLQVEQRELLHLLDAIYQMLQHATNAAQNPTVQVYLWDAVTYEHLVRIIGRHLPAIIGNNQLRQLAWLFPPETVVANPDVSDRKSPLTIVRDVVRAIVAAPVPHYYSLLNVAREYHSTRTQAPWNQFQVPGLFEDPLSDQIPSERAHEIWSRATGNRPWNAQLQQLDRTVKTRLSALESVTQRLEEDLRPQLGQTAPRIADLGPPTLPARMSYDGRLWFVFAKLNSALTELEVQQTRAMPPHEREARFRSAHLTTRLAPAQAGPHLTRLNLPVINGRWVYELAPGSREVRARENDINFALAPMNLPGFLDRTLAQVTNNAAGLPLPNQSGMYSRMERVSAVSVAAVDRDNGIIVVDVNQYWLPTVLAAEHAGLLAFAQDVMLDPVHQDFLVGRLETTLNAIGSPPIAQALPAVAQALGARRRPRAGAATPAADVLWDGQRLYATQTARVLPATQQRLIQGGVDLNQSQWQAWTDSLSRRLQLVWGPPGTGKSSTLRAVLLGALHEAAARGVQARILISGPTYEAIDNVLLQVADDLTQGALALPQVTIARLRSSSRIPSPRVPQAIDVVHGSPQHQQLTQRLQGNQGITLVGGTVHQVHRLLEGAGSAVTPLFDLIVLDEASQLDVGTSTLAIAGLANDGSVVVAGDPRQLPPIHQAQAPVGLESFVGPVFTYLQERHQIPPAILNRNYRSNSTIVSLGQAAGYPTGLVAHSSSLALDLLSSPPTTATPPANWPQHLFWTPEWAAFLDPALPCSLFVYDDGRSSQWNPFEADAVASLVWLLSGCLSAQLANELDRTGALKPRSTAPYSAADFWAKGVGVVTPHRAQQALVVSGLQRLFGPAVPSVTIRESVDTVERFQGQQRDVMIATFALGDPDAISDEDEFLLSLNRFNVMASRARAKLIVLVSRQVVDHLSADPVVLRGSALLKTYAETFCSTARAMSLGYIVSGVSRVVGGEFRWRS